MMLSSFKRRACRKNFLVNDTFGIVLLSTFLIVIIIYYVSPPAMEQDQTTETEEQLAELVRNDIIEDQLDVYEQNM